MLSSVGLRFRFSRKSLTLFSFAVVLVIGLLLVLATTGSLAWAEETFATGKPVPGTWHSSDQSLSLQNL